MKRRYNFTSIFHILIITSFILSFSACGYKDDPFYDKGIPQGDENVEFYIKKSGEK